MYVGFILVTILNSKHYTIVGPEEKLMRDKNEEVDEGNL